MNNATTTTPGTDAGAPFTPIVHLVRVVAEAIVAHAEELTALDQAIGDGDHGLNMKRGMEAVLAEWPKLQGQPPAEVLRRVGMQLVMKVGGASGPLFGTLAMEFGKGLPAEPGREDVARALQAAVAAIGQRGKSEPGQKTMLDVLRPVADALAAGRAPRDIAALAQECAEATVPMRAIRGRASFLGDRSIGHMDPGARSSALIIGAIIRGLEG